MSIIETTRLLIRVWSLDDQRAAINIYGDSQVMKYINSGKPESKEEIIASLKAGIKHQEKYNCQHWAVVEKSTNQIIGACGFNTSERPNELEMVFHFAKSFWGNGYATEAALAAIEVAKNVLRPKKIIASCHPDNLSSKRVLEKVGFTFMGMKWFEDTKTEEPYFELQT